MSDPDDDKEYTCSICFESSKSPGMVSTHEEITHVFHRDCLEDWLITVDDWNCPVCRGEMDGFQLPWKKLYVFGERKDYERLKKLLAKWGPHRLRQANLSKNLISIQKLARFARDMSESGNVEALRLVAKYTIGKTYILTIVQIHAVFALAR